MSNCTNPGILNANEARHLEATNIYDLLRKNQKLIAIFSSFSRVIYK
jgi:hypothetical protein